MVKRALVALAIMGLAGMLLPGTSGIAQVARMPHENPATAESSFSALSVVAAYGELLGLVASGESAKATALAEILKNASIPEELVYIIGRFDQLSSELGQRLSSLKAALDETSPLIAQGKRDEAAQKLAGAGAELQRTEGLVRDIKEASRILADRLGAFRAAAPGQLTQAYDLLQQRIARLAELTETYRRLMESLEAATLPPEGLYQTQVTVSLDAARAPVGGTILVSGNVVSEGRPLPDRTITILLDDQPVSRTESGSGGSYQERVTIPPRYVPSLTVKALYTPADRDRGVYAASTSPPKQIEVAFWDTALDVQAPGRALLGLPVIVAGRVSSPGQVSPGEREMRVFLDGDLLATGRASGPFRLSFVPEAQVRPGKHTLTVVVDRQGPFAGVLKQMEVELLEPRVAVEAPGILFLPGTIEARVRISPEVGPLSDVRASLGLGGVSTMLVTSEEGGFTAALDLPLSLTLVGPQQLEASIEPVEPGHPALRATTTVFVVNPANLGLLLALFVSAGVVMRTRLGGKGERVERTGELSPTTEKPVYGDDLYRCGDDLYVPEVALHGLRGRILAAYQEAVLVVESATGISMMPSMTVREFLGKTTVGLGGARDPFSTLTGLVERALYRPQLPGSDEAIESERLSVLVRGRVPGGRA
jgi:hypothetical protein